MCNIFGFKYDFSPSSSLVNKTMSSWRWQISSGGHLEELDPPEISSDQIIIELQITE